MTCSLGSRRITEVGAKPARGRPRWRRFPVRGPAAALVLVAALASSCAYYNTFYLAKKYYATATGGLPYPVERPTGAQTGNYQKSVDYAKKVISRYPKSKWVDDAYLLWAQGLLGKDDPLQAATMLEEFPTRFPASPRRNEAVFYLGVAQRQARKYREALTSLDEFLAKRPGEDLVPYAHLERARCLMALQRHAEAVEAASQAIERFAKSETAPRVRAARAEALLAAGDPMRARADFQALGLRSRDDNERFGFLLREVDCLEAARDYSAALTLLNDGLASEPPPVKGAPLVPGSGAERYGQLTLRIGTVHLLAGRHEEAMAAYRNVTQDFPKTPLAAEAQYRIGYTYEIALDDFEAARREYAQVREQSAASAFFAQAMQRQQSLDRLARYRSAGSDSLERKVEAGFLLAEQYLFQLEKPERALAAYGEVAREHAGTPAAAKALTAQAWVLRRKLGRPAQADSLLWVVVRRYPATEPQLAARDYLEAAGHEVPANLIRMPQAPLAAADTAPRLTRPPGGRMPLGPGPGAAPGLALSDSLAPRARGAVDEPRGAAPRSTAGARPPRAASGSPPGAPRAGTAHAPGAGAPPAPPPARSGSPLDDPPRPMPERAPAAPDTSGAPR